MRTSFSLLLAAVALALGVVAGVLISFNRTQSGDKHYTPKPRGLAWQSKSVSTAQLGQQLMARVGQTFVSDSRKGAALGGVIFYTKPKPFGGWLCRFNAVYVAPWIVRGGLKPKEDKYNDEIGVTERYAVPRLPITEVPDRQAESDCAAYRDFEHSFIADEGLEERAIFLLNEILEVKQSSGSRFPVTCVDRRSGGGVACNWREVVASLGTRSLDQADKDRTNDTKASFFYTDRLIFWADHEAEGHPEITELTIESEQKIGKESDREPSIRAVHILVEAL